MCMGLDQILMYSVPALIFKSGLAICAMLSFSPALGSSSFKTRKNDRIGASIDSFSKEHGYPTQGPVTPDADQQYIYTPQWPNQYSDQDDQPQYFDGYLEQGQEYHYPSQHIEQYEQPQHSDQYPDQYQQDYYQNSQGQHQYYYPDQTACSSYQFYPPYQGQTQFFPCQSFPQEFETEHPDTDLYLHNEAPIGLINGRRLADESSTKTIGCTAFSLLVHNPEGQVNLETPLDYAMNVFNYHDEPGEIAQALTASFSNNPATWQFIVSKFPGNMLRMWYTKDLEAILYLPERQPPIVRVTTSHDKLVNSGRFRLENLHGVLLIFGHSNFDMSKFFSLRSAFLKNVYKSQTKAETINTIASHFSPAKCLCWFDTQNSI